MTVVARAEIKGESTHWKTIPPFVCAVENWQASEIPEIARWYKATFWACQNDKSAMKFVQSLDNPAT